jgi:DNA repair exonuclease SbcCD ATPase subunit
MEIPSQEHPLVISRPLEESSSKEDENLGLLLLIEKRDKTISELTNQLQTSADSFAILEESSVKAAQYSESEVNLVEQLGGLETELARTKKTLADTKIQMTGEVSSLRTALSATKRALTEAKRTVPQTGDLERGYKEHEQKLHSAINSLEENLKTSQSRIQLLESGQGEEAATIHELRGYLIEAISNLLGVEETEVKRVLPGVLTPASYRQAICQLRESHNTPRRTSLVESAVQVTTTSRQAGFTPVNESGDMKTATGILHHLHGGK